MNRVNYGRTLANAMPIRHRQITHILPIKYYNTEKEFKHIGSHLHTNIIERCILAPAEWSEYERLYAAVGVLGFNFSMFDAWVT